MRAYHRVDPLMDERKSHYSPAQLGTYLKVQLLAGRQTQRGWFRSRRALEMALPSSYLRHLPFLFSEGDLQERGEAIYVDGWDEWQEGDLTVKERMARLRNRRRNATVTGTVSKGVTEPSPTAIRVGVGVGVGISGTVVPTARDAVDALYQRTGQFPSAKVTTWLKEMEDALGSARLRDHIDVTPMAPGEDPVTYLRRIRDALRLADHHADRAEQAALADKARTQRAKVRPFRATPPDDSHTPEEIERLAREAVGPESAA